VIGGLVGCSQSAFVEGRSIIDNILFIHEIFKCYSWKWISPRCVLKVDLKVYDTVEWGFLKKLLSDMGFPTKNVHWIMTCVSTVSYSLMINGGLTQPFNAIKSIRQENPISPYIFVLALEYLGRQLIELARNGNFNFHPRFRKLGSVHFCFADDLLIYCRADIISVRLLNEAFIMFSKASGLHAI